MNETFGRMVKNPRLGRSSRRIGIFQNEGYKISIDVGLSVLFSSVIEGDKENFTEVKKILIQENEKLNFNNTLLGENKFGSMIHLPSLTFSNTELMSKF